MSFKKKGGLQAGEFSLHSPLVMCSEMSGLAPLNGTLFSAPPEEDKYLHETIFCRKCTENCF
jgi:hypothetical protein